MCGLCPVLAPVAGHVQWWEARATLWAPDMPIFGSLTRGHAHFWSPPVGMCGLCPVLAPGAGHVQWWEGHAVPLSGRRTCPFLEASPGDMPIFGAHSWACVDCAQSWPRARDMSSGGRPSLTAARPGAQTLQVEIFAADDEGLPWLNTSEAVEAQNTGSAAGPWPRGIHAVTLFVEDLATTKSFYEAVFRLPLIFEDDVSAVFKFENTLINLLSVSEASRTHPAGRSGQCRFRRPPAVHHRSGRRRRHVRRAVPPRRRTAQRPHGPAVGHSHRLLPRPGRTHLGNSPLENGSDGLSLVRSTEGMSIAGCVGWA